MNKLNKKVLLLNFSTVKGYDQNLDIFNLLNECFDNFTLVNLNKGKRYHKFKGNSIALDKSENESWLDYVDDCEKAFKGYDMAIIYRPVIYSGYNYNTSESIKQQHINNINENRKVGFINGPIHRQVCANMALDRLGITKTQLYVDPQEFGFNDVKQKFFITNHKDMKFLPTCEYALFDNRRNSIKTHDLTLYFTVCNDDRKYLVEYLGDNVNKYNIKMFTSLKDKIPFNEYQDMISMSNFTLILPAYDKSSFSMWRFFEALTQGCLPLVLDICDLEDIKLTYPDLFDYINKYLLVNNTNIEDKMNELLPNRDKHINDIFNLESIRNVFNKEWCINYIIEQFRNI